MPMKTKQELHEQIIVRMLWNKKKEMVVWVTILLMMIIVAIWKWDRVFVDFSTFAKIYLIAVGGGFCLGMVISNFIRINVSQERHEIGRRMRRTKEKLDELYASQDTSQETRKIRRVRRRLVKLEAEWEIIKRT